MVVVLEAFEARVTLLEILPRSWGGLTGLRFVDTCKVIEFWASCSGVNDPCWITFSGDDLADAVIDVFSGDDDNDDDDNLPLDTDFAVRWVDECIDEAFCSIYLNN